MSETVPMLALKTMLLVMQTYGPSNALPMTPAYSQPIPKPQSLGDAADAIIRCYHPTGHILSVVSVEQPWAGAGTFRARSSVVLRIDWKGGFVGMRYSSFVALMERDGAVRTVMLKNGTAIPPNPRCQLEQWTFVER